jgi:replication factor C large subunit
MWHLKHRPETLDDFLGNSAREAVRKWGGAPLIIHGPTGTGKSLLANLIARERDWELFELTNENIASAPNISGTQTLFGGKRLLLIEDAESIRDIKLVNQLVETSKTPIILATSDPSNKRLKTLSKKCDSIGLRRQLPSTISKRLFSISKKEGVEVDKSVIDRISKSASGDLRAAITDLETISKGNKRVTEETVGDYSTLRDRESDIYKALSIIFGGKDFRKVVESTWDLSETPRDIIWWVDENLPRLYPEKKSIRCAYENLSRADIFLGRIGRRQYWGFLRYASPLMTMGANSCRPEKIKFSQYRFPGFFAALGRTKAKRTIESSIAQKLSPHLHVSKKTALMEYIPLLSHLLRKGKTSPARVRDYYGLSEQESEYLTG